MLTPYIGEVVLYAFNFAPHSWAPCAGQLLPLSQNVPLFSLIRNEFGGNGVSTFALPDYTSLAPEGMHYCIALEGVQPNGAPRPGNVGEITLLPYAAPATWISCNGQSLGVDQFKSLFQIIGTSFGGGGSSFRVPNLTKLPPPLPSSTTQSPYCISNSNGNDPETPFLCEVRLLPSWSTPAGWLPCKGQLLPVNVNQPLFSLLGTTFGGDGLREVGIPNLSRAPVPEGLEYCISVGGTFPRGDEGQEQSAGSRPQF